MKKFVIIVCLSLSILLTFGCSKDDEKDPYNESTNPSVDLEDEETSIDEKNPVSPIEKEENIEIPIDEGDIVYEDDIYGFNLLIPESWRGKYTVGKETWIDDKSESITFNFKDGEISNNIFAIVIMDESITEDEWEELFLIYIVEQDGKTYSYLNIMEPTEELLKDENKDKLEIVTDMVETVPEIMESFNLKK